MSPLLKRCSLLLAAFCLLPSTVAPAGERIPFSMHDAPPVVSQTSRAKPAFSMHAADEETVATKGDRVAFSVHDAKPLDLKPDGDTPKPDCSPARTVNRVLVIHPATATIKVKVCDDFGCRFELRTVPHPILSELKKLSPRWSAGNKECDHFRLVNADDPKQAELLRELDVKREELPLLVKETDIEKRKKAAGMSAEEIAKQWNKWFQGPEPDTQNTGAKPVEKCLPNIQGSSEHWTYPGTIRQHLIDPRSPHHLPQALVDSWTDQQCIAWHNWHHEVLSGRRVGRVIETHQSPAGGSRDARPTLRQTSFSSPLENRIASIAQSTMRAPPSQMVAAANASYGHSSDARKAKKKRSMRYGSGKRMNVAESAGTLLVRSSPSSKSPCSTRSRC